MKTMITAALVALAQAMHGEDMGALLTQTPHEVVTIFGATPTNDGGASIMLDVETQGKKLVVALTRNDDIFAEAYEHIVMNADGSVKETIPSGGFNCVYRGHVFAADDTAQTEELGNAMLSVCDGEIEGHLHFDEHELYIAPHPAQEDAHVVFRHDDWGKATHADEWSCGHDGAEENIMTTDPTWAFTNEEGKSMIAAAHGHDHEHDEHAHEAKTTTSERRRRLAGTAGTIKKTVEMLIVNDYLRCKQFKADGKTLSQMTTRSAAIMAQVTDHYVNGFEASPNFDFEFRFTITKMISFPFGNPWTSTPSLVGAAGEVDHDKLLSEFGAWVETSDIANDNAHMLTGEDFEGGTVGYAGVGGMCRASHSTGISMAHVTSTDMQIAGIVAHEIGHNVGMLHTSTVDTINGPVFESCYDANHIHIMDGVSSGVPATQFSTCSKSWMDEFMNKWYGNSIGGWSQCADDAGTSAWSGAAAVCGDGVREGSEQCDCGPNPKDCETVDPCCDGTTCMLKAQAKCSLFDTCCQSGPAGSAESCTFKPSTATCRDGAGSCNPAETCTGDSAVCPDDTHAPTGTACTGAASKAPGLCFAGGCQSQAEQCSILTEEFAVFATVISGAECPTKGSDDGDDGCGTLSCKALDSDSCYGNFKIGDSVIGVENGAPCGVDAMCSGGVCESIPVAPVVQPILPPAEAKQTPLGPCGIVTCDQFTCANWCACFVQFPALKTFWLTTVSASTGVEQTQIMNPAGTCKNSPTPSSCAC